MFRVLTSVYQLNTVDLIVSKPLVIKHSKPIPATAEIIKIGFDSILVIEQRGLEFLGLSVSTASTLLKATI